mmetsp:Transcript_27679/g.89413  ORF Transcript_27679/g.89413 Transcript_27679/m.89413 type:complete len:386 (-) Transcript_27679:5661-6818(-)
MRTSSGETSSTSPEYVPGSLGVKRNVNLLVSGPPAAAPPKAPVRGVPGTADGAREASPRELADPPGRAASTRSSLSGREKAGDDELPTSACWPRTMGSLPHTADQRSRSLAERSRTASRARSSCGFRYGRVSSRAVDCAISHAKLSVSRGGGRPTRPVMRYDHSPAVGSAIQAVHEYSPSWKGMNWTDRMASPFASSLSAAEPVAADDQKDFGNRFATPWASKLEAPAASTRLPGLPDARPAGLPRPPPRPPPPAGCVGSRGGRVSNSSTRTNPPPSKAAASCGGGLTGRAIVVGEYSLASAAWTPIGWPIDTSARRSKTSVDAFEDPMPSPRERKRSVPVVSPVKAELISIANLMAARGSSRRWQVAGAPLVGRLRSMEKAGEP